ncbi:amino acid adenylation domain-containing protein [Actinoplanes sp. NPDC004185]
MRPLPGIGLHRLLLDSARRHPGRDAVADQTGHATYEQVNRLADALAGQLAAAGVEPGDRVLIWGDKSVAVVAAMQAVLRLGAAYVPADGTAPVGRVAFIARDCTAAAAFADPQSLEPLRAELDAAVPCLALPAPGETMRAGSRPPVDAEVAGDDLAYILYTSGSTGTPKGVCISHRNARAFVDWAVAELGAAPDDRFANHAPLTFDLSVLDLYVSFAVGAAVDLVPAELAYAPRQLVDFLYERRISVWYSVPSALTLMAREGLFDRPAPPSLRAVLFAGEPFPIAQVRRLAAWTGARLLNLYGPTETNVCTFHEVRPADLRRDRPVPIGTACSGDKVWARRPDGTRAAPGEQGELVVDGPTVMLGYWGGPPQHGPYPTGDIVEMRPDLAYDYIGRRDHMVKIRGHRVELGEVESVLASHPDVEEAAVIVVGEGATARLEAYVVPVAGRAPGLLALKRHSAERLPRYMIADALHLVGDLPRTRNGKVDRGALLEQVAIKENVS